MTGRHQTTKGVWLSKSPKISDTCTLIMDLEGSDGRERGEDDTNFERQSALFALAVADVLLINVWCHDIGREQGSGKPLMKTVFQVRRALSGSCSSCSATTPLQPCTIRSLQQSLAVIVSATERLSWTRASSQFQLAPATSSGHLFCSLWGYVTPFNKWCCPDRQHLTSHPLVLCYAPAGEPKAVCTRAEPAEDSAVVCNS